MREFTVRDWDRRDLLDVGTLAAFGMRPQKISAAEPYCLKCGEVAWPSRTLGRWDAERKATAIPFDVVYVEMSCGCAFGDELAANPTTTPEASHE